MWFYSAKLGFDQNEKWGGNSQEPLESTASSGMIKTKEEVGLCS